MKQEEREVSARAQWECIRQNKAEDPVDIPVCLSVSLCLCVFPIYVGKAGAMNSVYHATFFCLLLFGLLPKFARRHEVEYADAGVLASKRIY